MATKPRAAFGDLLRHARRNAGLTQEMLAERAGLSTRAISDLERGFNRAPRRDTLGMLADALELSLEERGRWERARKQLAVRSSSVAMRETHHHTSNLPTPLTTFVGRQGEIDEIADLMRRPEIRLVTLTGPGGVGKTRLALMVLRVVKDDYPDGVWFINLAPLNNPGLVLPTAAKTLNIAVSGNQPVLAKLTSALAGKRTLLLLDNMEHVADAALEIAELVHNCPGLTIMSTSRVPLHVQGEQEYLVSPLDVPDPAPDLDLDQILLSTAVALFVQRSQSVRPDFRLIADNARTIVEICQRLDGIPLAIELAAARIRLLSPQLMLSRLERRLPLLTGGARDLPVRQQTLRNTIAWSYDLLTPGGQDLFQLLSVFRGGWTLEAAAAVADNDVLDELEHLVEHNLVRVREQPDGVSRYSMLETIREFGLEQLRDARQETQAYHRHGQYFVQLAESAIPAWRTHEQALWAARLETELDNLRAALTWFMEHDVELACRLIGALWRFFMLHGQSNEGWHWLEAALGKAQTQNLPLDVHARVLEGIGILAYMMSDYAVALRRCNDALAIWQTLGNHKGEAWMLHGLGRVAYETGDYSMAESYYNQSLGIYRAIGDPVGVADMLNVLGVISVAVYGNYDQARARYEESLELRREAGDLFGIFQSLSNLGENAISTGDYLRARSLIEESLAWGQKHHLTGSAAMELRHLGMLALRQGDHEQALIRLSESTRIFQRQGGLSFAVKNLMQFAELAASQCRLARVAHLGGAIEVIAAQINLRVGTHEQNAFKCVLADTRSQVDTEEWVVAWAQGRTMSLDEAIDYAVGNQ